MLNREIIRSLPTKILAILLLAILALTQTVQAQTATVQYTNVENIYQKQIDLGMEQPINVTMITYTFAVNQIDAYGDKVYVRSWVERAGKTVYFIMDLYLKFSLTFGLAGIGSTNASNFLYAEVINAEFPYGTETINGTLYHFFRIYLYINFTLERNDNVRIAAAYNQLPTIHGSDLIILKIHKLNETDGSYSFKMKKA